MNNTMEEKALSCPVCQSNKAEIAGENVKLSGKYDDKEFLTTELTVLRCVKCGYYMFFDKQAKFTTKDE
jgi:predicted nucleic-acid-binding Zn-ribbon protein